MYMPVQIQLKMVKMVEIEPESDVPGCKPSAAAFTMHDSQFTIHIQHRNAGIK